MSSQPSGDSSRWLIILAFPAGVVVLLLGVALVLVAFRPAEDLAKPKKSSVARDVSPSSPTPSIAVAPAEVPRAEATEPSPPPAVAVAPSSGQPLATPSGTAPDAARSFSPTGATAPAPVTPLPTTPTRAAEASAAATGAPIDLLAPLDLATSSLVGDWQKDGSVLRCTNATQKARAKLRLVPPPASGGGYDFAVTFSAQGRRRMVTPVLSFRGHQFIFVMYGGQSGFASVKGQNATSNETTVKKGITANAKHTSVIKVRDTEVSAYLDDVLLTSYATDYSDLGVSDAWSMGANSAPENVLGLAVECPVTIEAITLTPLGPQTPAAPTKPPAPTPASSYKQLAAIISSPWSSESSVAATQPAANKPSANPAELQALVAASQPVVSDVAADLLRPPGAPAPAGAATQPSAALPAADADALFRAAQLSIAPPTSLPADPLLEAQPIERPAVALARADFDTEQARLAAWRMLVGRMSEFYPNAKPLPNLVKVRLAAEGDNKGKPVSFFATHTNPEALTNVTLAIEIVHAMTSPSPTTVRYYFIRRWQPGQKIFFPASCIPNVSSRELLDSAGPSELTDLGGMIEARTQLWSDQFTQPSETASFDANFAGIAHAQLAQAYRLIDDALRRPVATSKPAGAAVPPPAPTARPALVAGPIVPPRADVAESDPDFGRARALARRAQGLLPPQSSLVEDAKNLAEQPQVALRDLRKKQIDAFVGALGVRTSRTGFWVVRAPGTFAKLAKPADREAVVGAAGNAGGRLTMTIDARNTDGTGVAVTITSADQPDLHRKLAGRLQLDSSANRLLLNLRATLPPLSRPPAEGDLKKVNYWNAMLLEMRGNSLIGIATAGPTEAQTVLNIVFTAPTAAEKPAAPAGAPPRAAPPPAPRPRPTTAKAK